MLFRFFTITLLILHSTTWGQESVKIPDSLVQKTYKELAIVMYKVDSTSSKTFSMYAHAYFKKAKKDTSTLRLLQAYNNLSRLGYLEETEDEILYLDSIIDITKSFKVKKYPEYAYFVKGHIFYEEGNFKKSFDNYLTAYTLAKQKNEIELMYKANYGVGVLKNRIGEYKESLQIFKECKKYFDTNKNFNDPEYYLATLSGLTDLYRKNKKIDSSSIINKIGIKKALANDFKGYHGYFVLSEGMNLFEKSNYPASIDSLQKAITILYKVDDQPNIAFANFYLAKNYIKKNTIEKAILNLKKVDTIFLNNKDLNPDIRETYEILIDFYRKREDKDNELLYIQRLMRLDSILTTNYKYLSKNLNQKYDTPLLVQQKEQLISEINTDKTNLSFFLIGSLILSFLILILLVFNAYRKKIYKSKFENLLRETYKNKTSEPNKKLNNSKEIGLTKEISDKIRSSLKKFEQEKGFLDANVSITDLAKQLDTNTKYLSKFINYYHQKSLITYINDLRIEYAIEALKNDRKLRNYTIKAISEHVGFKNSQSFSQAFTKKTGLYPSYFIKKLDKSIQC